MKYGCAVNLCLTEGVLQVKICKKQPCSFSAGLLDQCKLYYIAFTIFVKRDFLFAALFLCRIPLEAALSIVLTAVAKAAFAASASFAATAASTPLILVFTLDIALLFLKVRTLATWARLAADLILAKIVTSFSYLSKTETGRGFRCIYSM